MDTKDITKTSIKSEEYASRLNRFLIADAARLALSDVPDERNKALNSLFEWMSLNAG